MTIMILLLILARLVSNHLPRVFWKCSSTVSAQNMATRSLIGAASSGRASVAGCVSPIVDMHYYAGCNNNIVSWRIIKQVCPGLASLSAPCVSQLQAEHRKCLLKDDDANDFIRDLTAPKQLYAAVQVVHPKTVSCSARAF